MAAGEGKKKAFRVGKIAIVGRPNVGKSTLLNALLGERIAIVSRHAQTTRDRIAGILTQEDVQFVFLDTPGVHSPRNRLGDRMNTVSEDASAECDVVLFLSDLGNDPKPGLSKIDQAIVAALPSGKPVILVLNKVDRLKDKTALLPLLESLGTAYQFAAIVPISALKNRGTERILAEVKELLPKGELLFEEDELSDRPTRFFVSEFVREQILQKTREEVPHGVAVTVESFDESKKVPHIDVVIHVDKESHKPIIIGKKGSLLREVGTQARARVEELLGKHVHLAIRVRVTPGWYENERDLATLGYGSAEGRARREKETR